MRILVSWSAYINDYTISDGRTIVNVNGPHCELYNEVYDYDAHVILSGSRDIKPDRKFIALIKHLRDQYQKKILPEYLNIQDVISIQEIKAKLSPILAKYRNDDVEAYISPGTPSMQTVWYLLACEYTNVKLFQIRPPQYRDDVRIINRDYIKVERAKYPQSFVIREEELSSSKKKSKLFKTESIQAVLDRAEKIASTDKVTALISGETGTGKELVAAHIHKCSSRSGNNFRAINCSALSDELLESRLFGHLAGSFSGATNDSDGAFVEADNGTIFLDEIGDISPKLQQTLLRVIQEREIAPIGTFKKKKIDVRIIVASHKDLWKEVELGNFREDLLYRIAVAEVQTIPVKEFSLKERKDLINHFLRQKSILFNRRMLKLDKESEHYLLNYMFPGNIRELEHLIERFYTFCEIEVTIADVPERVICPMNSKTSLLLKDAGLTHIKMVYHMFSENLTRTAKALGISPTTLNTKIKEINKTSE